MSVCLLFDSYSAFDKQDGRWWLPAFLGASRPGCVSSDAHSLPLEAFSAMKGEVIEQKAYRPVVLAKIRRMERVQTVARKKMVAKGEAFRSW
ncbi:hypothetical protein [Acanthopleuribacter pedis]|uniref:Uncharacterized protein n=1 Tax=Acanthopleuribacter pedis TaxID=442870 RepID=A0A8J7QKH1_9BACT|nr:hypothetical protein [Acanthopleuribacter pedis]MBO1322676.1 hypothetical protein [Acanthopleuribacter pedis]